MMEKIYSIVKYLRKDPLLITLYPRGSLTRQLSLLLMVSTTLKELILKLLKP
jgi:hypothetical protein